MSEGPACCGLCYPYADSPGLHKKASWGRLKSKRVSSILPWPLLQFLSPGPCLSFCSEFLPWWIVLGKCKPSKPCSPQAGYGQCFIPAIERKVGGQGMACMQFYYWKGKKWWGAVSFSPVESQRFVVVELWTLEADCVFKPCLLVTSPEARDLPWVCLLCKWVDGEA